MRANEAKDAERARSSGASQIVAIVVYDGLSLLEFAVACDVFGPQFWAPEMPWYRLVVCASQAGPVSTDSGLRIYAEHTLEQLKAAETIVVPPCDAPERVSEDVLEALRQAHARGARLVSLCTGAFVLAEAGLLEGRRATTHWASSDELAQRFPGITVDPDVLYVDGEDILTSAGSAASIDLCLHVVRADFGADVAASLARELVVPPYREGGQAQYIDSPMPDVSSLDLFAEALSWAQAHLDEPVTISDLAGRSAMSRRTFARRFQATIGTTPYRWLLRQRVQLAERLLETTDLPIDAVAERSGFVTAGNLRKHFSRQVRISPHSYRLAFRSRAS
jgi:AraC family transcriptional regulator, transcriptional activator FtrA